MMIYLTIRYLNQYRSDRFWFTFGSFLVHFLFIFGKTDQFASRISRWPEQFLDGAKFFVDTEVSRTTVYSRGPGAKSNGTSTRLI